MNFLKKNYYFIKKETKYNYDTAALDISALFKLEENITCYIKELQINNKMLDLIYFKYYELKNKINNSIDYNKDILIEINNQKKIHDLKTNFQKLQYQKKLYKLLCNQTNKTMILKQINEVENIITQFLENTNDFNTINKFNSIKNKNGKKINKIIRNKNNIPSNLSINEQIKWYENKIEERMKIKMIFDAYLFSLENIYKEIIKKKMLEITK